MSSDSPSESFAALFEQQPQPKRSRGNNSVSPGTMVSGVIVKIGRDGVFIELDGKQQAVIEAIEVTGADGQVTVKEGETLRARVISVDERSGLVRLGNSAGRAGTPGELLAAKDAGLAVEGKVTGVNKGGFEIDLGGARAFCPTSQMDRRPVETPATLIGQTFQFLITDFKDAGRNVVVSRRALMQREAQAEGAAKIAQLVVGSTVRGVVSAVRDFGAFVDLGGVEGLLPRSEIGHDRSQAVADAVRAGDQVEVQVREIKSNEKGETRITLSLKALMDDPWAALPVKRGDVVSGTVSRSTEFGLFVRIAQGIDGLLHQSELKANTPKEPGTTLLVLIQKLDPVDKRISLALAPDGTQAGGRVEEVRLVVGSVVKGTIERIENYGVFVQVAGAPGRSGRGLVPLSELGVPRGTDLRKTFAMGTEVTAKVLENAEGKLKLSLRGAADDAERAEFEAVRGGSPRSLGTLGDLFKNLKKK